LAKEETKTTARSKAPLKPTAGLNGPPADFSTGIEERLTIAGLALLSCLATDSLLSVQERQLCVLKQKTEAGIEAPQVKHEMAEVER